MCQMDGRAGDCLGEDFADLAGKDLTFLSSVVLQLFVHKVYKTFHLKSFYWHIVDLQCCISFGVQQSDTVIHTHVSTLLKKELFYLSVYIWLHWVFVAQAFSSCSK